MVKGITYMSDNINPFFTKNLQTQKSINRNGEDQRVLQKRQVFIDMNFTSFHLNEIFFCSAKKAKISILNYSRQNES